MQEFNPITTLAILMILGCLIGLSALLGLLAFTANL
jgi:hypothetical protein